ncbi:pancreatic secretory granule membrane major glycoprotein GP2-like [Amblyraja radiata]|uniref:pancreatic secretory granule membrane major glycoprotein GP2-like n=1 Tax=Amblyraja radiata TaxID=386614 RepID=UPI0014032217|nr:pancreatic secretory granule membrane major glycoprotein GP2-like [Amblyraja radiata]
MWISKQPRDGTDEIDPLDTGMKLMGRVVVLVAISSWWESDEAGFRDVGLVPAFIREMVSFVTTDSALGDPCVNHTVLDQPWRSTDCSNTECSDGAWMHDENLAVGWYRFNSSGGWKIPETVVPVNHCSGKRPGWLAGRHPSVREGEVTRTVCFTKDKNICEKHQEIRVKNCTGYFVYQLWPSPNTSTVYCTGRSPFASHTGSPPPV